MRRSGPSQVVLFLAASGALWTGAVANQPLLAGDWRWWGNGNPEAPPEGGPMVPAQNVPDPTPGVRQRWFSRHVWPPQPRPVTRRARLIDQYYAAHYWPYPFTCEDQASVRAALDLQAANGWVSETTLYDQHFDPETNEINQAGKMQLQWILLHAPPAYRTTFVATADTAAVSQSRLASAQSAVAEMAGCESAPPVMLRVARQMGSSAEERDLIRRRWLSTLPSPRINYASLPTSSGSGAGN